MRGPATLLPSTTWQSLLTFIRQHKGCKLRFHRPSRDPYPVTNPQKTTGIITMRAAIHNQDDKLVFEGAHRYLIKKRSA